MRVTLVALVLLAAPVAAQMLPGQTRLELALGPVPPPEQHMLVNVTVTYSYGPAAASFAATPIQLTAETSDPGALQATVAPSTVYAPVNLTGGTAVLNATLRLNWTANLTVSAMDVTVRGQASPNGNLEPANATANLTAPYPEHLRPAAAPPPPPEQPRRTPLAPLLAVSALLLSAAAARRRK